MGERRGGRSRRSARCILLASGIVTALVLTEVGIRVGIALKLDVLRDPDLYADPYSMDLYWKLDRVWNFGGKGLSPQWVDPELGWAPQRTARNPLGVLAEGPYEPVVEGPTVLCFGDSFMAGSPEVPLSERLPQQLDALLEERTVYNFGVGGYGLDQICLRLEREHAKFHDAVLVVGILMADLDRSLLSFRGGPKPRFRLEKDSGIELEPLIGGGAADLTLADAAVGSFLYRLVARKLQPRPYEGVDQRELKSELNRRILDRIIVAAKRKQQPLLFVLFHFEFELQRATWRRSFLHEKLQSSGIPFVDSDGILVEALEAGEVEPGQIYLESDHHLSARGYELIAPAVAAAVRELSEP